MLRRMVLRLFDQHNEESKNIPLRTMISHADIRGKIGTENPIALIYDPHLNYYSFQHPDINDTEDETSSPSPSPSSIR